MKVSEAVQEMTKAYLQRVIDSFARDFPKSDEERAREIILRNVEELTDPDRIKGVLDVRGPFAEQILLALILEALVNRPGCMASEAELVDEVTALEQRILDLAERSDALRYEDDRAVEVMRAVMEVALEDERLSNEELHLIRRLREKLGLTELSKHVILAQLNHFPRSGNIVHTASDFRDALIDLQRRGVLFYCNRLDGGRFVVPEEMVGPVKEALGLELSTEAYRKLLEVLTREHLATILDNEGLPKSGRKHEQLDRIVQAGVKPSVALGVLSNQDLYEVCSALPGAKVSGSKGDRIARVIDYFDKLVVHEVPAEASPGERYYKYLVELAARDRENLLANQVISKDLEMERAFEEGTCFLFTEKLRLELEAMPGSDHCDGCIRFGRSGDLFMWDNKSKESVYTFPPAHQKQFKRYIRDSHDRVSCFLVIVPEIGEGAEMNAARLKVESGTDTDVALITAEDLVWVAETWAASGAETPFNLEVLNVTGVLNRKVLENRLKLFASLK